MSDHSNRPHPKAYSIQEILDILERKKGTDNYFPNMHWVGANYSQADLIRDLKEIQQKLTLRRVKHDSQ